MRKKSMAFLTLLAVLLTACGTSTTTSQTTAASAKTTTTSKTTALCGTKAGPPTTSKVMVIWEENHGSASIIGSSSAPYINQLANDCGLATNYDAINHPSLPNYMAITSGLQYASPWTSDCDAGGSCLTGNHNIFDQVGPSGWKSYAESMNGNCQFSSAGPYATKHNPAPYYVDVAAACATNDVPLGTTSTGALRTDVANGMLPTFSTVTPNLNNDMHDGSIAQGDSWLGSWIPQITAGSDYRSGHLTIIITWDEDEGTATNQVTTIVMSPYTPVGTKSATHFTHFSTLKSAEQVAGVPQLDNAASANSLRPAFGF
jgi:hypothetical protein